MIISFPPFDWMSDFALNPILDTGEYSPKLKQALSLKPADTVNQWQNNQSVLNAKIGLGTIMGWRESLYKRQVHPHGLYMLRWWTDELVKMQLGELTYFKIHDPRTLHYTRGIYLNTDLLEWYKGFEVWQWDYKDITDKYGEVWLIQVLTVKS